MTSDISFTSHPDSDEQNIQNWSRYWLWESTQTLLRYKGGRKERFLDRTANRLPSGTQPTDNQIAPT